MQLIQNFDVQRTPKAYLLVELQIEESQTGLAGLTCSCNTDALRGEASNWDKIQNTIDAGR
ncbi:hypothetical protein D3H35_16010 [Cohnella faecalis]|uniref:Uncharacterized protein n=1 Tax=Cohnella faecalis TaxID=2315694 RepID=A0A398CN72_9BACL|nr:hypothetical protein D3H35_16010 [Cohnella faecalis]